MISKDFHFKIPKPCLQKICRLCSPMYLKMHFDCHLTVVPFEAGDVQAGYVEGLVLPLQEMELAERFLDMPNIEKKGINYKPGNIQA
jgi:hypothetical protein